MEQAADSIRILLVFAVVAAALSSCQGFIWNELKNYRQYFMERPMHLFAVEYSRNPSTLLFSSSNHRAVVVGEPFPSPSTSEELIEKVTRLCDSRQIESAMKVLENFQVDENCTASSETTIAGLLICFTILLEKLILQDIYVVNTCQWTTKKLQTFIDQGVKNPAWLPTAQIFHLVIQSWIVAAPAVEGASIQCKSLIEKQWSVFHQKSTQRDESQSSLYGEDLPKFIPQRETYFAAIRACSLRDRGVDAAKRAEALMDEMEVLCQKYPQLTPDRAIMNEVM
jgi:hypothetical protein